MDISVNGQSYSSWDQVPEELRAALAARLPDADHNGVPDLFETGAVPAGAITSTSVVVNGQTYGSVSELPESVQQLLRQTFGTAAPVVATPTSGTTAPPASPSDAVPRPGQVVLNGETVSLGEPAAPEKKGFLRRLFGG